MLPLHSSERGLGGLWYPGANPLCAAADSIRQRNNLGSEVATGMELRGPLQMGSSPLPDVQVSRIRLLGGIDSPHETVCPSVGGRAEVYASPPSDPLSAVVVLRWLPWIRSTPSVPSAVPCFRHRLPSTGSLGDGSPASTVLRLLRLPPTPFGSVSLTSGSAACPTVRSHRVTGTFACGPGQLMSRRPPGHFCGGRGVSQVPG
jgi:hypothetical protein